MVFGEQALPVRSELAVDDARNVMRGVAQQRIDGEADGRIRHVDDGIDAVDVEPFARDRRADVGLVLVVGIDDLDLDVFAAAVEILRRHPRGFHRAHAVGVLENAGDVVEHADAHDVVGNFRARRPDAAQRQPAPDRALNARSTSQPPFMTLARALWIFRIVQAASSDRCHRDGRLSSPRSVLL